MGTRLLVSQEPWRVTGVGYSPGKCIRETRQEAMNTPLAYVLLGAVVAAVVVLLIIVL